MTVLTLTQNLISQGFQFPAGKTRLEVCDLQVRGLYLDVNSNATNQGVFRLRFKDGSGKTCHAPLGHSNDVTLDSARRAATLVKAQITQGIFPNAAQKPKNDAIRDLVKPSAVPGTSMTDAVREVEVSFLMPWQAALTGGGTGTGCGGEYPSRAMVAPGGAGRAGRWGRSCQVLRVAPWPTFSDRPVFGLMAENFWSRIVVDKFRMKSVQCAGGFLILGGCNYQGELKWRKRCFSTYSHPRPAQIWPHYYR